MVVPSEAVTSTVVFGRLVSRFFVPIGTWFQLPLSNAYRELVGSGARVILIPVQRIQLLEELRVPIIRLQVAHRG
jgi:hypothetical protein